MSEKLYKDLTPEEEFEGLGRSHTKFMDKPKYIAFTKKLIKNHKVLNKRTKETTRINSYRLSTIHDCFMIKIEFEKFREGTTLGTRTIKLYLSEPIKNEIINSLKALTDNSGDYRMDYAHPDSDATAFPKDKSSAKKRHSIEDIDLHKLYD